MPYNVGVKKKQIQPKTHAPKTRIASALRRKKIIQAVIKGESREQAGIKTGLSPKTAASQVSQILTEPKVMDELRLALEKAGITILGLCQELKTMAFSDIKDHMRIDEHGAIHALTFEDMGEKTKAMKKIKEITKKTEAADGTVTFKDSRIEFELYDKLEAVKFCSQLRGMHVPQKHEVDIVGNMAAEVAAYLSGKDGTDGDSKKAG